MKYSIWVVPPAEIKNQLEKIIKNLAAEYNGPLFEPHMTILGNIEMELQDIEKKLNEAAKLFSNLELSFGPISFSTTYFQNVLIRINSTAQLMNLNLNLKKLLDVNNDVFMPHISLLYGDHAMEIREKAVKNLKPIESAFKVNELVVTPSVPNPSDWVHSLTIPFNSR